MTLTQLRYVIAVDAHRHFAAAAEECYVTQPTLSMQIKKLEDEMGITIFDRSRNPVIPTEEGKKFLKHARSIVHRIDELQTSFATADNEVSGTLRVGVIPTIAPYLIPLFLQDFTDNYPNVNLVFKESITEELLKKLNKDQLDVCIIATPPSSNFKYEHLLYYEPFVGYISSDHPLADQQTLSVEDIKDQHLWLLREGHCFRDQTIKLCKRKNQQAPQPAIQFESGNLETLKHLVEQNFGMTLLPYLAAREIQEHPRNNICIKNFEDPVPQRKVRLVFGRKHLKRSLIDTLEEQILISLPPELTGQDKRLLIE